MELWIVTIGSSVFIGILIGVFVAGSILGSPLKDWFSGLVEIDLERRRTLMKEKLAIEKEYSAKTYPGI